MYRPRWAKALDSVLWVVLPYSRSLSTSLEYLSNVVVVRALPALARCEVRPKLLHTRRCGREEHAVRSVALCQRFEARWVRIGAVVRRQERVRIDGDRAAVHEDRNALPAQVAAEVEG